MRRAVIGIFKSLNQAKEAIEEVREERLANNYVSVVVQGKALYNGNYREEFAQEISHFPAEKMLGVLNGYLIQSGPVELPDIGEVLAGGPFAGTLLQEAEKGLSGNLANYGMSEDHARVYEQEVKDGKILVIIEADNDHINRIANTLQSFGGRQIEKWSTGTFRATYNRK